jgi:hypothetical protein
MRCWPIKPSPPSPHSVSVLTSLAPIARSESSISFCAGLCAESAHTMAMVANAAITLILLNMICLQRNRRGSFATDQVYHRAPYPPNGKQGL